MMIDKARGITPLQRASARREASETQASRARQYDRVELTTEHDSEDDRFAKMLASRIAQEVRTQRPGNLTQLQQQIQTGGYEIHANQLATQILLFGGGRFG